MNPDIEKYIQELEDFTNEVVNMRSDNELTFINKLADISNKENNLPASEHQTTEEKEAIKKAKEAAQAALNKRKDELKEKAYKEALAVSSSGGKEVIETPKGVVVEELPQINLTGVATPNTNISTQTPPEKSETIPQKSPTPIVVNPLVVEPIHLTPGVIVPPVSNQSPDKHPEGKVVQTNTLEPSLSTSPSHSPDTTPKGPSKVEDTSAQNPLAPEKKEELIPPAPPAPTNPPKIEVVTDPEGSAQSEVKSEDRTSNPGPGEETIPEQTPPQIVRQEDSTPTPQQTPILEPTFAEDEANLTPELKAQIGLRSKEVAPVFTKLATLETTEQTLRQQNTKTPLYNFAGDAVAKIREQLKLATQEYIRNGDLAAYKSKSKEILDEKTNPHMQTLNIHRGGVFNKEVLVNIGLFILGLGVFYGIACAVRGGFFKVDTKTKTQIVAEMTETIDNITPTAPAA